MKNPLITLPFMLISTTGICGQPFTPNFDIPGNAEQLSASGEDSLCRRPDIVEQIIKSMESTPPIKAAEYQVIDFINPETVYISVKDASFSCHGTINISNGQLIPGTFIVRKNTARKSIWQWMNDDTP